MRCRFLLGIFLGIMLGAPPAPASQPTSGEFAVPLQATSPRPLLRSSGRVRTVKDKLTGTSAFRAKTAQAAIRAATNQGAAGCWMIRFRVGFGWVAAGHIRYPASDNPVARRRSQQEARFKAFTDARTQLSGCLRDLSPKARQDVAENLEQDSAIRLALINLATNDAEKWEQALRILARGFVAYSVEEDPARNSIQVNLVATPKTAAQLTRPAASAIEAASIKEGLRQLLTEIQAGLIPPVGNRFIVVNASGELTLVGYAINLIGVHPNPAAQDKLSADAEKIATIRATEALIGLATGDDARWQGSLDEISQAEVQIAASGYDDNEPSVRRFWQIHNLAMASAQGDPGLHALRDGNLPASVAIKRFSEEDRVTVAVIYSPTVRKPAAPAAEPVVELAAKPSSPSAATGQPTSDLPPSATRPGIESDRTPADPIAKPPQPTKAR